MPRVLRIINRFNLGGPTYNAAYLTRYLGMETRLIGGSPQPGEAHSGYILDELGVPYTELPEMGRAVRAGRDVAAFHAILRIIREFRPDIVHTHAAKAGALGRMAARYAGVPVIVHTYHGHVFDQYFGPVRSKLVRIAERTLGRMTDAVIAISPAQREDLTSRFRIVPAEKVHVIPLGFDLDRFTSAPPDARRVFRSTWHIGEEDCAVGIIGRFAAVKDHRMFLQAFALAHRQAPRLRAVVVGDGSGREALEQFTQQLGLTCSDGRKPADVVFTSWIRHMETAFPGLDMVALSSRSEGTPVSLIEAQAAGLPVISTRVGGVADVVPDGEAGFLTPQGDPEAMAQAMVRLAGDTALRHAMGSRGCAFVLRHFHYTRLVEDTRKLYTLLLQQKSAAGSRKL